MSNVCIMYSYDVLSFLDLLKMEGTMIQMLSLFQCFEFPSLLISAIFHVMVSKVTIFCTFGFYSLFIIHIKSCTYKEQIFP